MPMPRYEYIGRECLNPNETFEPWKYRIDYRCNMCGEEYSVHARSTPRKDPPCPNEACVAEAKAWDDAKARKNMSGILESGRFPGIGGNRAVQVIDDVAENIMATSGLTDLQDNVREGDVVAPKLPPKMQQAADNLWTPQHQPSMGSGPAPSAAQVAAMQSSALGGAFGSMAVNPRKILGEPGTNRLVPTGTRANPNYRPG